jgi:hypothetical protein
VCPKDEFVMMMVFEIGENNQPKLVVVGGVDE